jgi:hypothetical protein
MMQDQPTQASETPVAPPPTPPVRPPSSPREIVAYLKGARAVLTTANGSRQRWIRELGVLMRSSDPADAERARTVGRQQGDMFRGLVADLAALPTPGVCDSSKIALTSWLDKHIAACDVMFEAGEAADLSRLRAAQGLLAEARIDLQRFNSDVDALVVALRRRADEKKARRTTPKVAWPFGRPRFRAAS